MDESVLGSRVQELNKLTLITDMAFGKFAEALQSGLSEVLADRPRKVDKELFLGRVLADANGSQVKVTEDLAEAICEDLISCGYVKRGQLTEKYYADKASGTVRVAEEVADCVASVVDILSMIYDNHAVEVEDANGSNVEARLAPEKLKEKAFLALWEKINQKSFYTVSFDTQELIQKAIDSLDKNLKISHVYIKKEYGEQEKEIRSKEQLLQGKGFRQSRVDQDVVDRAVLGSVRYDLVGNLV